MNLFGTTGILILKLNVRLLERTAKRSYKHKTLKQNLPIQPSFNMHCKPDFNQNCIWKRCKWKPCLH